LTTLFLIRDHVSLVPELPSRLQALNQGWVFLAAVVIADEMAEAPVA